MDNLYDSTGRKIIIDRTNGPHTPEGGTGGAGHYGLECNEYCIGVGFNLKEDPDFPDQYYCHAGCGWNNGDFYCAYGERKEMDGGNNNGND